MDQPPKRQDVHEVPRDTNLEEIAQRKPVRRARRSGSLDIDRRKHALKQLYQRIELSLESGRAALRAEEWLLDNRHVVEDALVRLETDLPAAYLRSLPHVEPADGGLSVPWVRELARVLVESGGDPVDFSWLERAVETLQDTRALTIGELWALPAFLSLAVTDRLLAHSAELFLADGASSHQDETRLSDSIAAAVISLRSLAAHDWRESFERLSRVDRILSGDPSGTYADMDFESRNRYRRVVERLARHCAASEIEVAAHCVELSGRMLEDNPRHCHVGYWLIARGIGRLEAECGYRRPAREYFKRFALRFPGVTYFSLLILFAALPGAALVLLLGCQHCSVPTAALTLMLALIPISGLAVALVNGLVTWRLPPRTLARLDFDKGIPDACRSAVAVPVIFFGSEDVDRVFERLESNFLANDDGNLIYVVLGDLRDSESRGHPDDRRILGRVEYHMRQLRARHGPGHFLFLCRQRQWNDGEGCWMGWERKRGKLMEFNRLLAGKAGETSFNNVDTGEQALLNGIRYVITLDADTRMPPGTARQLVGTLAHPLSRAVHDQQNHTLRAGYSIIQPRLESDPDTTRETRFTRIFSGDVTVDLYTHASSDVYHDLFGEGIFTGKGIYDWQALEFTLAGRIPENAVLSHDLLEGVHGRVGLASDIVLMEEFPSRVVAFMRRQHRWVRGDWQLLPWLRRRVRTADGGRQRNRLKLVHCWKIVDNLRRSVQPPAVLGLMMMALAGLLPGHDWIWLLLFAALLAAGLITQLLDVAGRCLAGPRQAWAILRQAPPGISHQFKYWLLSLALLPYQSYILLDAIVRTLVRLTITRRHLLEWTTAARLQQSLTGGRGALWLEMWSAPAAGLVVLLLAGWFNPGMLPLAAAVAGCWLLAPIVLEYVDRARISEVPELNPAGRELLRRTARRTWYFFDRFVDPDTHWLPPDNYQQDPHVVLAARTSPTNMGMALNAALAAHDFGWMDARTLAAWLRNCMEGMSRLERYRGHWLNWYEIRDLRRLEPAYVSTVDSGNLAVALIVLVQGLKELESEPMNPPALTRGIADTLAVVAETIEALPGAGPAHATSRAILADIEKERGVLASAGIHDCRQQLQRWRRHLLGELAERVIGLAEDEQVVVSPEAIIELRTWLSELRHQIDRAINFLDEMMPWLADLPELSAAGMPLDTGNDDWRRLTGLLTGRWRLNQWPGRIRRVEKLVERLALAPGSERAPSGSAELLDRLRSQLEGSLEAARRLRSESEELRLLARNWVGAMDFSFLYDNDRHLFRIGYDVSNASPDPNHYDLLASEARLASLVAIAHGHVPLRHWIHLGRPFRRRHGQSILMSWGGTLFEYLMPRLYTRTPPHTLLDSACRGAIALHRDFAAKHRIPWGISESAFYQLDEQRNYAYRTFGVPGLGFRRDLGARLVVAPYASIMALPYDPEAVVANLRQIMALRGTGLYGFYEAIDFGRRRNQAPRRARMVQAWMSHHQGMALIAIDNYLNDDVMVRRFQADAHEAGVSMLLHERLPRTPPRLAVRSPMPADRAAAVAADPVTWPSRTRPRAARYTVLSNGHLTTLVNSDGGGVSLWQEMAINRWRPEVTTNPRGLFIYVRDMARPWPFSITTDPAGAEIRDRQVSLGPHVAEFRCRHDGLMCRMRIAIAAQHDIEARRVVISNESGQSRRLLVSSFAELAMAAPRDFERHPAFSRLFIESEALPGERLLVFRRRPRSSEEKPLYVAHMITVGAGRFRFLHETDRCRFIGRNGGPDMAAALAAGPEGFTGRTGAVVDPAMASGVEIEIEAHGRIELAFLTGVGRSGSELLDAMRSYQSMGRIDWLFEQAQMQTSQELHYLGLAPSRVHEAMNLMSATLEPQAAWRRPAPRLERPLQELLWSHGISGDWPIIVVTTRAITGSERIDWILRIHTLLAGRKVRFDLVIIDEVAAGYEQVSRDRLHELADSIRGRLQRVLTGPVIIVPGNELSVEQRHGLMAAASVVLDADGPALEHQLRPREQHLLPPFTAARATAEVQSHTRPLMRPEGLRFDNGTGGFSPDGREYVIHLEPGESTPAPWSNVLANSGFGTLVTESGSTFTWAGNSSEYRLTPWPNDPVSDLCGEILYLRDEETGQVWTPTPSPGAGQGAYQIRHAPGHTVFIHHGQGLIHRYCVHVDPEAPVKFCSLELTNTCDWDRRITATAYLEWVLGNNPLETAIHLECDLSLEARALLAVNPFDRFSGGGHAFVATSRPVHGFTMDRVEFLGRGGTVRRPAGLERIGLSGAMAGGAEACAALQSHIDLPAGETRRIVFVIGHGECRDSAVRLATRFATEQAADESLRESDRHWRDLLGRVRVETPDESFNLLINQWLPYQTIAARLTGRTGYYQSSGGIGFRDQLQDAMAMVWLDPTLTRRQILSAAERQFAEGDVLHWWHEAPLRGVRTRCSDDLLWLPFVTAYYVQATGDTEILGETAPFLTGEPLATEESERYAEYGAGTRRGTLFEHCARAIDRACTVGPHGLPVIGSGDWNDGFNRVSTTGRGESVWLAWFLARVLKDFSACCQIRHEPGIADQYRWLAEQFIERAERHGWDGQWYRRAYYDDGSPLGSSDNRECRIDLIAQAWAVLAADAPGERAEQAMRSALELLVDHQDRLILLLDPPFNHTLRDPGYIKGYPPGIRENGAQYTHAATWAVWAAARLGWEDRAHTLFSLLDPIRLCSDRARMLRYRNEPYVLSGDIYSQGDNRGRAGWSWYTGASAWLYRAGIEAILGMRMCHGRRIEFQPCLPPEWPDCRITLELKGCRHDIVIRRESTDTGEPGVTVRMDGRLQQGNGFDLAEDGREHAIEVTVRG